jgi:hypothetical protein
LLESIRSLFARTPVDADSDAVASWAKRRGGHWKREKDGDGFAIDGHFETTPWRLEWGKPQRPYIVGRELRMRMALGLPPDLQMMVMSAALRESLEKAAFDDAVQSNQTQVGDEAAEETRWLVLFPRIAFAGSKVLRGAFAGVSSLPHEGPAWLEGALAQGLERATTSWLQARPPFLLMTLRGKIYLRLQLAAADVIDVAAAVELFETAARAASRIAQARADEPVSWSQTASSAWQSLPPDKPR